MNTVDQIAALATARFSLFGTTVKIIDIKGSWGWATPANGDGSDAFKVRIIDGVPRLRGVALVAA